MAERIAKSLDVDAVHDSLTPRQFDEWVAYYMIEKDPWDRIAEILVNGFMVLVAAQGGEIDPEDLDPPLKYATKANQPEEGELTCSQQVQMLQASGVPGIVSKWW